MARFNRLVEAVRGSLQGVQKAVQGLVLMSKAYEELIASLLTGQIPSLWAAVSYPSLKPLAAYVADLGERCKALADWCAPCTGVMRFTVGFAMSG
eukprot:1098749-Pyramimonas_sp.AAC.1